MAETIKGINISIGAETTGLSKALSDVNRQSKAIQSELRQVEGLLKFDPGNTELLAQKQKLLADAVQNSSEKLDRLRAAQAQVNEQFSRGDISEGQYRAFQREIAKTEQEISKARQEIEKLGNTVDDTTIDFVELGDGAESAGSGVRSFGDKAKAAVVGVAAVGAAAIGAAASVISFANDSAKAMNKFQAQTGVTAEEMQELKQIATDIYAANLGESMEDVANAMAEVRRTTGTAGEALKGLTESALILRDAFGYEVNETTRTANTLMKQFGITGEQAMTLIAQGAQNGADKNGDLLDTLNEYSPQFKALGFDAEQFTNILIQGAENGAWSIDKVGDAIKEFNIRAKDGSKTSNEAFKQLGLNADLMSKSFAAGGETAQQAFSEVIKALEGIEDPVKRNQIGVALFGTQFEDLEAQAILALGNVEDRADKSADTLQKMNEVKFNDLGSALEGLKRNLMTNLQPLTDSATTMIADIVTAIRNGDWAGVGTAISEGLGNILSQVVQNIPNMVTTGSTLLTGLINAITEALPIALPALANAALQILTSISNAITENLPTLIPIAIQVIEKVIQGIIEALPALAESSISIIQALADGIMEAMPKLIEMLPKVIEGILNFITENLPSMIEKGTEILLKLIDGIIATIPKLLEALPKVIDAFIKFITDNLPKIVEMGIKLLLKLIDGLINAIPKLVAAIPQIITALIRTIVQNLPKILKMGIDLIVELVKGLIKAIPELVKAVPEIIGALVEAFGELLGDFGEIGKDIIEGLWEGIKSMGSWIKDKVSGFVGGIVDNVKGVLGIHSPSRVFRDEVGKMIGLGMAEGISDSVRNVQSAMDQLNSELTVGAVGGGSLDVAATGSVDNAAIPGQVNVNFAGAVFNVRNDNDINLIAQKLGGVIVQNTRALGGA